MQLWCLGAQRQQAEAPVVHRDGITRPKPQYNKSIMKVLVVLSLRDSEAAKKSAAGASMLFKCTKGTEYRTVATAFT